MKKKIIVCLATGFYLGKIPWAPGTWGTLLGLPIVLLLQFLGPMGYMFVTVMLIFLAVAIAELYEVVTGTHDPGEIVIDEVVGFVVTMTWLPKTAWFLLAGFLLFRLFDIVKPYPIGVMDKKIHGGLGTVLDDVAAGLVANIILQMIFTQTNWLGVIWNGSSLG